MAWKESRQAALHALEGDPQPLPAAAAHCSDATATERRTAPRGQIRGAILGVVAERPGATAAEIATAANLDRRVTQSTLARLACQGAIERYSPPGGGTAYRPPSPTRDSNTTDASSPTGAGPRSARARSPRMRSSTRRTSPRARA